MYNISSVKENGEMMLKVTSESYFAKLGVVLHDFFLYVNVCVYTEYYMSKSVSHAVSTREPYITPRATDPRVI